MRIFTQRNHSQTRYAQVENLPKMKIEHKFIDSEFEKNFKTENAILKHKLDKAEVLILGTFNPNLKSNKADFFYGRNYFWTGFKNLFVENKIIYHNERLEYCPYEPTLSEITDICSKLKLTFSDLILSIFDDEDKLKIKEKRGKEYLVYNETEYNPISDKDLEKINKEKEENVSWNTENIIKFLKDNKQIKKVYFTRRATNCWLKQLKKIKKEIPDIKIVEIYTPSAQGGALHQQTNLYGEGKMKPLLKHWVHNKSGNYGCLDNNWLIKNKVNINEF